MPRTSNFTFSFLFRFPKTLPKSIKTESEENAPAKLHYFPFTPSLSQKKSTNPPTSPQTFPSSPAKSPAEGLRQAGPHLAGDFFRDLFVVGFGDAAGDAGKRVAVAAERCIPKNCEKR